MPHVFTLSGMENLGRRRPRPDAHAAGRALVELLAIANKKGDVIGASSYGSRGNAQGLFDECSDFDWIIVFDSLQSMCRSDELGRLHGVLKRYGIALSSPVVALESIQFKNHLLGPVMWGIRQTPVREVIGRDPVEIFDAYGGVDYELNLSMMFASYPRFFYEFVAANRRRAKAEINVLIRLLQKSVDYFADTWRSMIGLAAVREGRILPMTFESYKLLYGDRIPKEALRCGERVMSFVRTYRLFVRGVGTLGGRSFDLGPNRGLVANYQALLQEHANVVEDAVSFDQSNIEWFVKRYTSGSSVFPTQPLRSRAMVT